VRKFSLPLGKNVCVCVCGVRTATHFVVGPHPDPRSRPLEGLLASASALVGIVRAGIGGTNLFPGLILSIRGVFLARTHLF
jgi:hypothetical protein